MPRNTNSSAWYSDPESLLATLQQSQRPSIRTPEIPGYDDLRELRRGGQGVVYTGTQLSTKRKVAIKVLAAGAFASVGARRRFEREIDLAATLDHPNIVSVYDSGETLEGHPYFVMRYVDGVPFDAIIGRAPNAASPTDEVPTHVRPIRESLNLALTICDAISYAHRRGIIHRDLKPGNIRFDRDGAPYVLDFGLAKASSELFEGDLPTQMSMTGEFMGSLPWASPEQTEGVSEKIDIRTDVYSFGVLLYQMLTGTFPYSVTGPFRQVLDAISNTPPTPPSKFRPEIDDDLETIILKALEKDPERRYQSMPELADDIRHYLAGEPIAAKRDSALYTMRKNLARYKLAFGTGLAFMLLAVFSAGTMAVLYQRANHSAAAAVQSKNDAVAARDEAENQRTIAVREAETAKQINDMLTSMLATSLNTGREARIADALDNARDQLGQSETLSVEVRTELQNTIGVAYATLGLMDDAAPLIEGSYALQTAQFGEEDVRTIHTLTHLAWLRRLQGETREAESLYRLSIERFAHVAGEESMKVATTKNDLALVLQELSQYEEAESLLRDALETSVAVNGPLHPETLRIRMNVASILHSRGALAQARDDLTDLAQISVDLMGAEHLDTLSVKYALSEVLNDLGEYEEARILGQEVYEGRAKNLGPKHPSTLQTLSTLGAFFESCGDLESAYQAQKEAFQGCREVMGPRHIGTINVKSNLASITSTMGNLDESILLHREVLADYEAILGDTHEDTLRIMSNFATVLMQSLRWSEAAEILAPAVDRLKRAYGAEHPITLTATANYSSALREIGEVKEARRLAQFVTDTRIATLGPNNFDTLVTLLALAEAESADGDVERAAETAGTVYERMLENYGWDHWAAPIMLGARARLTANAGRNEEALEHYERALEGHIRDFGEDHYRTQTVLSRFLKLAREMERPEIVKKYEPLRNLESAPQNLD